MNPAQHHVFSLQEAAQAYSMTASRILGTDVDFVEQNQMVIPIFVSMLFQSVEVSLKSVGIESGLITREEARDRKSTRSGHGIKEIAQLMSQKLGDQRETSVVMALTSACNKENIATYIRKMSTTTVWKKLTWRIRIAVSDTAKFATEILHYAIR